MVWSSFRWFDDNDKEEDDRQHQQIHPIRSYDLSSCSQGTAELSFDDVECAVEPHQHNQPKENQRLLMPSSSSTFQPSHHRQQQQPPPPQHPPGGSYQSTTATTTILQRMRNKRTAKSAWRKLAQAVDHLLVLEDDDDDDDDGNHNHPCTTPSSSAFWWPHRPTGTIPRGTPKEGTLSSYKRGCHNNNNNNNGGGNKIGTITSLEQRVSFFWRSTSSSSNNNNNNNNNEPHTFLTLSQCFLAVLAYLLIAIVAFSFCLPDEHFTIINSCYFAVVTFTTIGYGDVTPHDDTASRCFTALFTLTGVTVLGMVLGHMGSAILDAQEAAVEQAKKDHAATLERIFSSSSRAVVDDHHVQQTKGLAEAATTSKGDGSATPLSSPSSAWSLVWEFARCLLVLAVFAAILAANDPGVGGHGWRGAMYYAIITATTVGYGDLAPTTQGGRALAVLLIPIAVAVMGHWISAVATHVMERRQMDNLRRKLLERDLQLADLTVMDENGDGQVSQLEFLRFMLVAMNKVDERTLEQIQLYFDQLDVDGTGTLNKDDIIANAKAKLRQTNRKLELSAYKQRLIALGRRGGGGGSGSGRQHR